MQKLWNRNFTILTIGSFVSALGSFSSGISFGILIYRETGSPLTLALFTVANIIPRMITGFLAGPFIDRHSRIKIIYMLDFVTAFSFMVVSAILFSGFFNVIIFTVLAAFFGVIDTIYQIAFMSLFPEAIPPGQHSKAYSIASIIWPISAAIISPIAAYMIENFDHGIALLMAFNSLMYLIAAIVEIKVNIKEVLNNSPGKRLQFIEDLREGFKYFRYEKGILGIGILFACFSFGYAAHDLLTLPFFMTSNVFTIQDYSFIITASSIGRVIGALIHYSFSYPPEKRFVIAIFVYFIVEAINASYLFLPFVFMIILSFIIGFLSVTSYTIRISATQAYIPSYMRGRINSTHNLLWNIGTITGALVIGFIAQYTNYDYRIIMLIGTTISIMAIVVIPIRMHREFKKIYNAKI
ncbi:MAG: MFS transporter [Candidatus Izemoplasmatales bacterium]|jgi:MFS family permease|nr:MFS transporter [Candidatus Izemoplasmatales bacterium]MDD3865182.1 MFS transporter [Candidatus Izemoplasmatales bacterium]